MITNTTQQETNKSMRPLIKKLKKCRDPDRVDLVALQKARREQAEQKKKPKPGMQEDAGIFGGALAEPDAKRRKTALGEDPFGPPLG
jgi:cyclin H